MSKLSKEELLEWLILTRNCMDGSKLWDWESGSKDNQAFHQIGAIIQKPEVTEEWIKEKAKELYQESKTGSFYVKPFCNFFIRKLVKEIK